MRAFASFNGKTQSAAHIKPLHWYVACRLVIEGGFDPDSITPRPPFVMRRRQGRAPLLLFDPDSAGGGERTILGGLKTKSVDVVVVQDGLGPVLAVSCKGVTGAFRNLTNRMEETIGECTNLHITYPALVMGYLVLLRANRRTSSAISGDPDGSGVAVELSDRDFVALAENDIAVGDDDAPVASVVRFHNALSELSGRSGIRDDVSRYEAVGMGLVETNPHPGSLLEAYPVVDSRLHLSRFLDDLYRRYDERFVVSAPDLAKRTRRLAWHEASPGLVNPDRDYPGRVAGDVNEPPSRDTTHTPYRPQTRRTAPG